MGGGGGECGGGELRKFQVSFHFSFQLCVFVFLGVGMSVGVGVVWETYNEQSISL